jgi:ATP-dependent Clp protease protease subunit
MRERINRIIARETGQSYDKIVQDTDRNFWIGADSAVAYGLVARVVSRTDEV